MENENQDNSLNWKHKILDNRYIILQKLNEGSYASVWICFDTTDKKYYAIKICYKSKYERKAAKKEEQIYNLLKTYNCDNAMTTINVFDKKTKTGNHKCFVLELMAGCLYSLIDTKRYQNGLSFKITMSIMKQVLIILEKLHNDNIIHGDIKPENILIKGISVTQQKLFDKININELIGDNEIVYKHGKKKGNGKITINKLLSKIIDITDPVEDSKSSQSNKDKHIDEDIVNDNEKSDNVINDNKKSDNVVDDNKKNGTSDKSSASDKSDDSDKMSVSTCDTNYDSEDDNSSIESDPVDNDINYTKEKHSVEFGKISNDENNKTEQIKFDDDLIVINDDNVTVKLSDMGGCITKDMRKHYHTQTRYYRSPELLLELDYDESSDMWALGCTMFELLTGKILFDAKSSTPGNEKRHHIYLITKKLGVIPKSMCEKSPKKDIFFTGDLKRIKGYKHIDFSKPIWLSVSNISKSNNLSTTTEMYFQDFVSKIFSHDPKTRLTASDALIHPIFSHI